MMAIPGVPACTTSPTRYQVPGTVYDVRYGHIKSSSWWWSVLRASVLLSSAALVLVQKRLSLDWRNFGAAVNGGFARDRLPPPKWYFHVHLLLVQPCSTIHLDAFRSLIAMLQ
jgi:hypothetical protein